jgi:hypothetical protein
MLGVDVPLSHRHSIDMNRKNKTSPGKIAIATLCISSMLPIQGVRAMPVTDSTTHLELGILNGTASSILSQAVSINASNQQIMTDTTAIRGNVEKIRSDVENHLVPDVEEIRADVDIIQKDIEVMRKVAEQRQILTDKINKLQELTTKGNVLKRDPFADAVSGTGVADGESIMAILKEMGEYIKTPDDAPAGHLGSVTTDDIWYQTAGDPVSLPEGGEGYLISPAYRINIDGKSRDGYERKISQDELMTPEVAGTQEVIDSSYEDLFGKSWNGVTFTGKGASYMQAMIGHGGQPLGLDHIPPAFKVVLSSGQQEQLKNLSASVTTPGSPVVSASLSKALQDHLRQNYRRASMTGKNPWELAPGFFVRPMTEADKMFDEMVLSTRATPASKATFYAAAAAYSRSQYDPYRGFSANAEYTLPVNVNDVLTRGAFEAIEKYNKQNGISENPYANFGKSVAPVIGEVVERTRPGQHMVITAADIAAAAQKKSVSLNGNPLTSKEWEAMFARSAKAENDYIRASLTAGTVQSTPLFVVFGLDEKDTRIFGTKMMANSTRLSQNNKTLLTQACLLHYNKEALEAVKGLSDALEELAQGTSEKNIVEMLPVFRDQAQNTILVLQNRIGQLQVQLDDLLKERHETLAARQEIIESYEKQIEKEAKAEVEAILMRLSATNVDV